MPPSKAHQLLVIVLFILSSFYHLAIGESLTHSSSHSSFNHLKQQQQQHHYQVIKNSQQYSWRNTGTNAKHKGGNKTKPKYEDDPKAWIKAHNKVRHKMGEPPLEWDKKLARYAQRFAATRVADCQMIHSDGPYGENIFWAARNKFSPSQVVALWVDEQRNYDRTHNLCASNKVCGHYTQIVWRDSTRLGCALVECKNGGAYGICSYSPPGNYKGEDPFVQHESTPA